LLEFYRQANDQIPCGHPFTSELIGACWRAGALSTDTRYWVLVIRDWFCGLVQLILDCNPRCYIKIEPIPEYHYPVPDIEYLSIEFHSVEIQYRPVGIFIRYKFGNLPF